MNTLQFTQKNGIWESSEFTVSGDFNLHIERATASRFKLMQKTSGTNFANVLESTAYHNEAVIDVDVQVLVPKTFKAISHTEVKEAFYEESL